MIYSSAVCVVDIAQLQSAQTHSVELTVLGTPLRRPESLFKSLIQLEEEYP